MPIVSIDEADVFEHFRDSQALSLEECERWLRLHKRKLEYEMRIALEVHLEDILSEVAINGYPSSEFDACYRVLDDIIDKAVEAYAAAIKMEFIGSTYTESKFREVISELLTATRVDTLIEYELQFAMPSEDDDDAAERAPEKRTSHIRIFGSRDDLHVQVINDE